MASSERQRPAHYWLLALPFPISPFSSPLLSLQFIFFSVILLSHFIISSISHIFFSHVESCFEQPRRDLLRWWHSACPSVAVQKCWQRGLYPAFRTLSIQLRGGLHLCWPGQSPNFPLHDFLERHCRDLSESMHEQDPDYSFAMMNVFFAWCQATSATTDSVLATGEGRGVVKDGFNLNVVEDLCWYTLVDILCKNNEHACTALHLCLPFIMVQAWY